jgi:hypothetical protein
MLCPPFTNANIAVATCIIVGLSGVVNLQPDSEVIPDLQTVTVARDG